MARTRPAVWLSVVAIMAVHGRWHPAYAQRLAVLVVAPPDSPIPADDVRDAVVRTATAHGQATVDRAFERAAERVRAGAMSASDLRVVTEARDLLAEGWRAYLAADVELARSRLVRARARLESALALPGVPRLYADICLRLGAVFLHQHRDAEARAALTLSAALDPERQVDEAWFAPDVVHAYRSVHGARPSVTVRVAGQPTAAHITIDDRDHGPAPVTVELAPGPHLVVARHPGYRAHARFIDVNPDAAEITVTLEPDDAALAVLHGADTMAAGRSSAEVAHALMGLMHYAELDSTLFVAAVWRANHPAFIAQRCVAPPMTCTEVVEVRFPRAQASASAAEELWSRVMAVSSFAHPPRIASEPDLWPGRDHRRSPSGPETTTMTTTGERCRICRNPWLWAGVGAALTTVGAILLLSRHDRPAPVIAVDPCQFSPCTR